LQEELEVLGQKKAAAVRAEKTAGQLRKDVRLLQEALADNNIIIDKVNCRRMVRDDVSQLHLAVPSTSRSNLSSMQLPEQIDMLP
jgi:hypothetical protein